MKRLSQSGFAHVFLLVMFAVIIAAIGYAGIKVLNNSGIQTAENQSITYQRQNPKVIKALLEPGMSDLRRLMTDEINSVRKLNVNTIYIYVDYSYQNKELKYTELLGGGRSDPSQIENEYIELVKLAKNQGFALHLATSFGGGANRSFGVPLEQFLKDVAVIDAKWAAISETYKVESFAPSSEMDYQIFREYFGEDWSDKSKHDKAAQTSNDYHDGILPEIRKVFKGIVVYQAGLHSDKLGSKGYDLFGQGANPVSLELSEWEDKVRQLFGYGQTNAERQDSDWFITELWIPVRAHNNSPDGGDLLKTPSGISYQEIQTDLYKIIFDEYKNWQGKLKPVGLGFTAYLNATSRVKGTPAEAVVTEFFESL